MMLCCIINRSVVSEVLSLALYFSEGMLQTVMLHSSLLWLPGFIARFYEVVLWLVTSPR